jgi:UDP-N-acetylmuramate--alanine ligase
VTDVVLSAEDPGTAALIEPLAVAGKRVHAFAVGPAGITVSVHSGPDVRLADFARPRLRVPGEHNLRNAAAALAVGALLGYQPEQAVAALEGFKGTARRFETVARVGGVWIVDDYAHHPTEVRATLAAARTITNGRILACFQPHLFTRTRDFADDFGQALALADVVVVLNVYPAREDPVSGVTGELVADAAQDAGAFVTYIDSPPGAGIEQAAQALAALAGAGDLVLTLGAGNVTAVGPALARLLDPSAARSGSGGGHG